MTIFIYYSALKVTISAKYEQYILRIYHNAIAVITYTNWIQVFVIWFPEVKSVMQIRNGLRSKKSQHAVLAKS